jgi:GNAT superfamily N-acetyltransferase
VTVRAAQAADAAELGRLLALPPAEAAARLEAMRATSGCAVLVATGWAGLAGVTALSWAPTLGASRPVAWLSLLLVDPDERRRGLGRQLLKAAAQSARAAGCDTLICVMAPSEAADGFAAATGFAREGAAFVRPLRRR